MSDSIFILAGESSGDLHGGNLARALRPHKLFGVTGPKMREAGVETLIGSEEFQVMGFIDVLFALRKLKKHYNTLLQAILERQPHTVVLVDFGGFNLRLARGLRKAGYRGKIVQYISPKVWAWGKGRVPKIAESYDLMLVIYPFETACYAETHLPTHYVGNPLTEALSNYSYASQWPHPGPLLSLFPGSRKSEIRLNLPRQLETARRMRSEYPELQVAVSVANENVEPMIREQASEFLLVPQGEAYDLMRHSQLALATSGTVTMELALHGVPTLCVYRPGWLNAIIAAVVLRLNLPHYCMVNIAAGEEIFPELIHTRFTPKRAAQLLKRFYTDEEARAACLAGCSRLREQLTDESASARAAAEILK